MEVQDEFSHIDPRIVKTIAQYPFKFVGDCIRDVDELRPIRLRYLGVFDIIQGKEKRDKQDMSKLILKALEEYGVTEIVGSKDNPRILEYFKVSGNEWADNDEYAWCSAFVNWVAIKCGYEATKKLNARSWLDVGSEITKPIIGDIVVLWRKDKEGPYGHVGFYINSDDKYIYILGGNQSNQVNIAAYTKDRLLGYRRLQRVK